MSERIGVTSRAAAAHRASSASSRAASNSRAYLTPAGQAVSQARQPRQKYISSPKILLGSSRSSAIARISAMRPRGLFRSTLSHHKWDRSEDTFRNGCTAARAHSPAREADCACFPLRSMLNGHWNAPCRAILLPPRSHLPPLEFPKHISKDSRLVSAFIKRSFPDSICHWDRKFS